MRGEHPNAWTTTDSRTTRWLTPPSLVEALGVFDLDPCGAPGHSLAKRTYLLEQGDDGLSDPWFGRVWLNPPYGKEAKAFLERMAEHNHGTALIFANTETKVFNDLVWEVAEAALFLSKRVTFITADHGRPVANAGKPSVLVAYGEEDAAALDASGIAGRYVDVRKGTWAVAA